MGSDTCTWCGRLVSQLETKTIHFDGTPLCDPRQDPVNPTHYRRGPVETIDLIQSVVKWWDDSFTAYCLGNVVKYLSRAPLKGAKLTDLEKARWYLERAIQHEQAGVEDD